MSGPLPTFHAPRRASAGHPTDARGAAARPLRRTGRVASARIALPRRIVAQSSIRLSRRVGHIRSVRVRSSPPRTGRYALDPTGDADGAEPVRRLRASRGHTVNGGLNVRIRISDEAARSNAASGRPCIRYHGIITSGGAADSRGLRTRGDCGRCVGLRGRRGGGVNAPRAAANTFPDPALKLP